MTYNKSESKAILEEFLKFPLDDSALPLKKFADLPGAVVNINGTKEDYVFVPGTRKDRIVFAAHADTVWDKYYKDDTVSAPQTVVFKNGVYRGIFPECGIGADDRAGLAMLWILKDTGHSLLILDGEERGMIASRALKINNPELFSIINEHNYIIQLDRRGSSDYKTYNIPVSDEFIRFIEENTGYINAGNTAGTDIVALCEKICGVNLSVGYYDEHKPSEHLIFDEWFNTLETVSKMTEKEQPHFSTI